MKTILLAGGLGTRISEETLDKPKPMVIIDDKPILWHVMNIYASQGFTDFIVATGYKGEIIAKWIESLDTNWKIKAVDTGLDTQTGGRIKQCMKTVPGERVMATYGDGLGNINIRSLLGFHEMHGKKASLTAVRPPVRFGHIDVLNGEVKRFGEKHQSDVGWINGGFFVFEPGVVNYIWANDEPLETGALPRLVNESQLMAFEHGDFWQPMDTLREKIDLSNLAKQLPPPWLRI